MGTTPGERREPSPPPGSITREGDGRAGSGVRCPATMAKAKEKAEAPDQAAETPEAPIFFSELSEAERVRQVVELASKLKDEPDRSYLLQAETYLIAEEVRATLAAIRGSLENLASNPSALLRALIGRKPKKQKGEPAENGEG